MWYFAVGIACSLPTEGQTQSHRGTKRDYKVN